MLGELVAATVVVKKAFKSNPPTEASLMLSAAKLVPKHAVPVMIIFAEELPRNANGKIEKKKIKESLNEIWQEKVKAGKDGKAVAKL